MSFSQVYTTAYFLLAILCEIGMNTHSDYKEVTQMIFTANGKPLLSQFIVLISLHGIFEQSVVFVGTEFYFSQKSRN